MDSRVVDILAKSRILPSTMPFYEYQCDKCQEIIVELQSLSEPALVECPSGDGGKLIRLLSIHNVGGVASGSEGAVCARSPEPFCGACGKAGTGCS